MKTKAKAGEGDAARLSPKDQKGELPRSKLSAVYIVKLWREYPRIALYEDLERIFRSAFGKGNLPAQLTAVLRAYSQQNPKDAVVRQVLARASQDPKFLAEVEQATEAIKRTPKGEKPLDCSLLLWKLSGKETPSYSQIQAALRKANLYQTKSADPKAEARAEGTRLRRIKRALKATGTQKKPAKPGRPSKQL